MADSLAALKSSVYAVQLGLLEGIASDAQLQAAGKVLTRSEYADVVTERTIVNLCGYPLCTHPLPENFPHKGRYRISLREHKVYDLQETRLFCSSDCLVSSQSFAASLPSDRDHTEKTIDHAAAFCSLSLQDVVHHYEASSLGEDMRIPAPAPKQEFDPLCHHQTSSLAMEIGEETESCVHKPELDPSSMPMVEVEEFATKQAQEFNPGSFLLIHEQAEIKANDFHTAGPSNAIEGYIPQREFHHKKLSDHAKDEMDALSSRHKSKEKHGDILRKKEREGSGSSKKKQSPSSKVKDSDIGASSGLETEFSSLILVDQAKPTTLEARCSSEPANSCSPVFTSCTIMDDKASAHTLGRRRAKKKQNRVSWADHNNLKLVEESPVSSGSRTSEDFRDAQAHYKERDQDNMSSLGNAAVVIEERSESLPSQERSFCKEKHENAQVHDFQNDNFESAKALVAALTEAAEAVAHGEADSSEAGLALAFDNWSLIFISLPSLIDLSFFM